MKKWFYLLAVPLALEPVALLTAFAQPAPPPQTQAAAPVLSQADLEQILAPIALYPDDLLTQVLVASTYPLEIVMADRWVDQPANKGIKGDALTKALESEDWDASVKSLVPFPSVLNTMAEQLDWTQKLGDAFLAQQSDVFAAVQALRGRAQSAGKLQSSPQQTVSQQGSAIIIQPTQTETVYVPAYNPSVVYGTWPYPASPPAYYPPPPGAYLGSALATGLAFGAGIAVTGALFGWGQPNWGNGSVNMNVNRFNNINANRVNNRPINSSSWQHNAAHRRGVGYSNSSVRQQYRPNAGNNAQSREAFRGRTPSGSPQAGQRPGGAANRPARSQGNGVGGGRDGLGNSQRSNARGDRAPGRTDARGGNAAGRGRGMERPNRGGGAPAFGGVGNGATTRAQSAQGRASRQSMNQSRGQGRGGGGGHARGGGGGGGRGGRR